MLIIHLALVARLRYTICEVMKMQEKPEYYTLLLDAVAEAIHALNKNKYTYANLLLTVALQSSKKIYSKMEEK